MSEFEASLTRERVISSLKLCRARGVILGRPRKRVDVARIESLRASGHSWRKIAGMVGLSVGKVYAAAREKGTEHARVQCA